MGVGPLVIVHTPEWVAEVCLYFLAATPLAQDVEAGGAAVTSSRSKGKYGEHLQPQTPDKRRRWHNEDVQDRALIKLSHRRARIDTHTHPHTLPFIL